MLTLWVAPPKMFYSWYRIRSRNQLWNCTHFRHPTDKQLLLLDNFTRNNNYLDHRKSIYYIQFELTADPCNLIGSWQCDLFTNYTVFCSKTYLFEIESFMFWIF